MDRLSRARVLLREGVAKLGTTDLSGAGTQFLFVATAVSVILVAAWWWYMRSRPAASSAERSAKRGDDDAAAGQFFDVIGVGILGVSASSHAIVVRPAASLLVNVVGVADPHQGVAAAFAKAHSLQKAYASCQALLDDDAVHAVFVATGIKSRARWVAHALRCGKHVLYEAPLQLPAAAAAPQLPLAPRSVCMRASHARHHPLVARLAARGAALGDVASVDVDVSLPFAPPQRYAAVTRDALLPHLAAMALDVVAAALGEEDTAALLGGGVVKHATWVAGESITCEVALGNDGPTLTFAIRVGAVVCGIPRARLTLRGGSYGSRRGRSADESTTTTAGQKLLKKKKKMKATKTTTRRRKGKGIVCDNFLWPHLWHRVYAASSGVCDIGSSESAYAADGRSGSDFLLRNFCSAIYRRREECREGKMAGGSGGAQAGDETGAERLLRAVWAKANDAE